MCYTGKCAYEGHDGECTVIGGVMRPNYGIPPCMALVDEDNVYKPMTLLQETILTENGQMLKEALIEKLTEMGIENKPNHPKSKCLCTKVLSMLTFLATTPMAFIWYPVTSKFIQTIQEAYESR